MPINPHPNFAEHVPAAVSQRNRKIFPRRLIVLLLVIVVVIGVFSFAKSRGWLNFVYAHPLPDSKLYQAVFLTNGQVYFGKIDKINERYLVLRDIYYLQVVQPLQQREPEDQAVEGQQSQQQSSEPTLNLVKMGSEIHGPTDKMVVPMVNVVFWEDIKSDGVVGKAIAEFKARQASGN